MVDAGSLAMPSDNKASPTSPIGVIASTYASKAGPIPLPTHRALFYGGAWQEPERGTYTATFSPATGEHLADVAEASANDVDSAVRAAAKGFQTWRTTLPTERARIMREAAAVIRANGWGLAALDALDGGNPISEMQRDAETAAASFEFFAGLITEMKAVPYRSASTG